MGGDISCWSVVPAPCDVKHCRPAARGLLSFLSLLKAFLLNVIQPTQAHARGVRAQTPPLASARKHYSRGAP